MIVLSGRNLETRILRLKPSPHEFGICIWRRSVLTWDNRVTAAERRVTCYFEVAIMCRNIKNLFNFDPPVTPEEVHAASLQFVRKISGFNKPSQANEAFFLAAIEEVAAASTRLLRSLETTAPPKNREEEAAKAKARSIQRFGTPATVPGANT